MDLMLESFPRLLNATMLTIELTLLSLFFGVLVFGMLLHRYLTTESKREKLKKKVHNSSLYSTLLERLF